VVKGTRYLVRLAIALGALVVLGTDASITQPDSLDDIYTTRTVVTGQDERNRLLGFRLCFEDVLIKVSGDGPDANGVMGYNCGRMRSQTPSRA
jgi:hypothetical protein